MPRPKRILHATALATTTPPTSLLPSNSLARIVKAAGNNLYHVEYPASDPSYSGTSHDSALLDGTTRETILVELPSRFRSTIWLKRGSYVVVDKGAFVERENKLGGEIVNVVREEREWRKMGYWPAEWQKKAGVEEDGSEDESNMGKMPPSDSEGEA